MSYERFMEEIVDEQHFLQLKNVVNNSELDYKILQIRPKTERDLLYIGLNNQIKMKGNLNYRKLLRFVEKKAL